MVRPNVEIQYYSFPTNFVSWIDPVFRILNHFPECQSPVIALKSWERVGWWPLLRLGDCHREGPSRHA